MRETFKSRVDVADGTFVESLGLLLELVVAKSEVTKLHCYHLTLNQSYLWDTNSAQGAL